MPFPRVSVFAVSLRLLCVAILGLILGCGGGGSGPVVITPLPKVKWTVLVYMNAANDLDQFSPLNMNQLETVANSADVRYVVQWKQELIAGKSPNPTFLGTRRYLVQSDSTSAIKSKLITDMGRSVDMGSYQTLRDFISWGKTYSPADRYVLVIWNHGNGWQKTPPSLRSLSTVNLDPKTMTRDVSVDNSTQNGIDIWDFSKAFQGFHFDIIAFDASLMQMAEDAYELKDYTDYVVGSEESPPGEGYPYQRVFAKFVANPDDTTRNLSKAFVDGMLAEPTYTTRNITQSSIDTSQLPALAAAVQQYKNALLANVGTLTNTIQDVRTNAQGYSRVANLRYYLDLVDVCQRIDAQTTATDIHAASTAVQQALANAVAWEGHNTNSPGSHGLSIDFSNVAAYNANSPDYTLLQWDKATGWSFFLSQAP